MLDDPDQTALLLIAARSAGRGFVSCGFPVSTCIHSPSRRAWPGTKRPIALHGCRYLRILGKRHSKLDSMLCSSELRQQVPLLQGHVLPYMRHMDQRQRRTNMLLQMLDCYNPASGCITCAAPCATVHTQLPCTRSRHPAGSSVMHAGSLIRTHRVMYFATSPMSSLTACMAAAGTAPSVLTGFEKLGCFGICSGHQDLVVLLADGLAARLSSTPMPGALGWID